MSVTLGEIERFNHLAARSFDYGEYACAQDDGQGSLDRLENALVVRVDAPVPPAYHPSL
jgi:hypothetical protein